MNCDDDDNNNHNHSNNKIFFSNNSKLEDSSPCCCCFYLFLIFLIYLIKADDVCFCMYARALFTLRPHHCFLLSQSSDPRFRILALATFFFPIRSPTFIIIIIIISTSIFIHSIFRYDSHLAQSTTLSPAFSIHTNFISFQQSIISKFTRNVGREARLTIETKFPKQKQTKKRYNLN